MVRAAHTAPVTAGMYRHFAAVTIAATLLMALFSDGETRKAVAREAARSESSAPRGNPNDIIRKDAPARGSFGTDEWVSAGYGQPAGFTGTTRGSALIPGETGAAPSGLPVGRTIFGVSAEAWDALGEEQRKALIARRQAELKAARDPRRAEQIDALLAASRARAGGAGDLTD